MHNVFTLIRGRGHVHGVRMQHLEDARCNGDGRRDLDESLLPDLTLVTGLDIVVNVSLELRPPETFCYELPVIRPLRV